MMADQGNFVAVEMRNRMFSCINDYVTTTSSSQVGQGATDVLHIAAWDVPLEPRDSRWPPAELKLQAALAELLESDPPEPIPKAMPKRPEAKPMPNPAATPGESSSTGATPKAKARPELKLLLIGLSRDLLKATCYVSLPIRITGIPCLQHLCG